MVNLLPDYTSLNSILGALSNPRVTALYLRRSLIFGLGFIGFILGFVVMVTGTEGGRKAASLGAQGAAAIATDGASLAVTGGAKAAKAAKGAASAGAN